MDVAYGAKSGYFQERGSIYSHKFTLILGGRNVPIHEDDGYLLLTSGLAYKAFKTVSSIGQKNLLRLKNGKAIIDFMVRKFRHLGDRERQQLMAALA